MICNGIFEDKDPDEIMNYLNLLAENAQNWDTTGTCEAPTKLNPLHIVEVFTTLGKIMSFKPNLHL